MGSKHTSGPWEVTASSPPHRKLKPMIGVRAIHSPINHILAATGTDKEDEANAEFIVRACNNFEALLEALQKLVPITWNDGPLAKAYEDIGKQAEQAITKATT